MTDEKNREKKETHPGKNVTTISMDIPCPSMG